MIINEQKIDAKIFAYDGCHKIYIIEDDMDLEEAENCGYEIKDIQELPEIYENSCELRFINNWKLTKIFAAQFENAVFNRI